MKNYIVIKEYWQDNETYNLLFECCSDYVSVKHRYYIAKDALNNLIDKLELFINFKEKSFVWKSMEKKFENSAPSISFNFSHKDSCGHILVEVFMEISDTEMSAEHHCCFYIEMDFGDIVALSNKIKTISKREGQSGDGSMIEPLSP